MAKKETKFEPPFGWLKDYTELIGLGSSVLIAAVFRFSAISSLPPGIDTASAQTGLQALNLVNHHWLPGLTAATGYAPIFVWVQALFIALLGHTATALRVGPALLGVLAVIATCYWVKQWFGLRAAWLASFLLAITPWAVTISRNGTAAALLPLIASLTMLGTALVWRRRNWVNGLVFAAVIALDLLSGPIGWLLAGVILLAGIWYLYKEHGLFVVDSARIGAAAGLVVVLALFGYAAGLSVGQFKLLPHATGLVTNGMQVLSNLGATLLMFNVTGDMNYRHNLAGMPMLNAFVGLMFVAGLIVAVSKIHERKYRFILLMFFVMLIPAVITTVGVPDAARAAGSMPFVFLLAATGISYMLDMWYRTFPINSAARTSGQFAILILLALSLFQGYTQYFRAWAATDQVYPAYNEGAVQLATAMAHNNAVSARRPFRYVIATTDENAVVQYLDGGDLYYKFLTPAQILAVPDTKGDFQFWVTPPEKDAAVASLKPKLPGGVLRPHYSTFNQAEIYYTYEVTK